MKVKIYLETELNITVPEKYSRIITREWWEDTSDEDEKLANEFWDLVNQYGTVLCVEDEEGEVVMEM